MHFFLVPQPRIEPAPSAVKARSSNHWTTREFWGLGVCVPIHTSAFTRSLTHSPTHPGTLTSHSTHLYSYMHTHTLTVTHTHPHSGAQTHLDTFLYTQYFHVQTLTRTSTPWPHTHILLQPCTLKYTSTHPLTVEYTLTQLEGTPPCRSPEATHLCNESDVCVWVSAETGGKEVGITGVRMWAWEAFRC